MSKEMGHWTTLWNSVNITDKVGFTYIITNNRNNRKYIGCKVFNFKKGKKYVTSDWKTYTGSNKKLNNDISKYGKEHFQFVLIEAYDSKSEMRYNETKLIILNNAIYDPMFYNEFLSIKMKGKKK